MQYLRVKTEIFTRFESENCYIKDFLYLIVSLQDCKYYKKITNLFFSNIIFIGEIINISNFVHLLKEHHGYV